MNQHEIETIFDSKIHNIQDKLIVLQKLTCQSRQQHNVGCWEALIKNYAILMEIEGRLNLVFNSLQWELKEKKEWEKEHGRNFDPTLICGDG